MECTVCTRFMKYNEWAVPEVCEPEREIRLDRQSIYTGYWL